ncbi:MAG: hypothetical protein M3077_13325 [Candidatus Dormibacteraeota bacterium]|nr:hypothetical protein [Candidatus Dormibacteraeota bacterium]
MALAQQGPQPQEVPGPTLTLRLDPLHNLLDVIVLGFVIAYLAYMGLGEILAFGWVSEGAIPKNFAIFVPTALVFLLVVWGRFRRVRLRVSEDEVEAVSFWGARKRCRLDELREVTEEGHVLGRRLVLMKKDDTVAFTVRRDVWTRMQLGSLETFLGVPVSGAREPRQLGLGGWLAAAFVLGLDVLFLVSGGGALVKAHDADTAALAYQRGATACPRPNPPYGPCVSYYTVTVESVGNSAGSHAVRLAFDSETKATVLIDSADRTKLQVGAVTGVQWWDGHLTSLRVDDKTWLRTRRNPFEVEQVARTGLPLLAVAFFALYPILRRLHPIVR